MSTFFEEVPSGPSRTTGNHLYTLLPLLDILLLVPKIRYDVRKRLPADTTESRRRTGAARVLDDRLSDERAFLHACDKRVAWYLSTKMSMTLDACLRHRATFPIRQFMAFPLGPVFPPLAVPAICAVFQAACLC